MLLGRLGHQHLRLHFFAAAAVAHTAHRRSVEIIAADGEPAVGAYRRPLVSDTSTQAWLAASLASPV
jgi:hypothetical protein